MLGYDYRQPSSLLTSRCRAEAILAKRQQVLDSAHATHPQRFVQGRPSPSTLPIEVWISPSKNPFMQERSNQQSRELFIEKKPSLGTSDLKAEPRICPLMPRGGFTTPAPADFELSLNKKPEVRTGNIQAGRRGFGGRGDSSPLSIGMLPGETSPLSFVDGELRETHYT